MTVPRFFAVILVFVGVTFAWMILGGSIWARTELLDGRLSAEIESLWGPKVLVQTAPYCSITQDGKRVSKDSVAPSSSDINVEISHEHRDKGLLWFSTFTARFSGRYTFEPAVGKEGFFIFEMPRHIKSHDGLKLAVDGQEVAIPQSQKASGRLCVNIARNVKRTVEIGFATFGQDAWLYVLGEADGNYRRYHRKGVVQTAEQMTELKDFSLIVSTDFMEIDYPNGTRSPSSRATSDNGGMVARWRYDSLATNQAIGVDMPRKTNPGPVAARLSFFAPVSLFFFFTVLFTVTVLKKIPLHPMHYLFIAAAFFAFHILLAYLADKISIQAAFWICAAVSVFLVVSYMRLVVGMKFAVTYVILSQLVYLVGFSYAFFWEGNTGLTITIGAIATLFILMQVTGKVDWAEVFKSTKPAVSPPPAPQGNAIDGK